MPKDPICGMQVDESSTHQAVRDGQTYYFCSEHCRNTFLPAPATAKHEEKKEQKRPGTTIYTCPMHPEVQQDHPGDCALPMLWAARNKLNVSAFITYTDSETWAGHIHPSQALRQYRSEFVGDAKAVVVGMTSNGFTLADPNDRGMLDVVGFDTSAPAVIADFIRNG